MQSPVSIFVLFLDYVWNNLVLTDINPITNYGCVCIPVFQASMMSAENDPLGPLPPGWGEFVLYQDQYMLFC